MLGLQPISGFAISDFDPNLVDLKIVKIKDDALKPVSEWLWTVEITPYQPGVNVIFADSDVTVEVSWVQFEVPA